MPEIASASLPDWPVFGLTDDVRPALAAAVSAERAVALATIFAVIGGSPRPVGSQMLIDMRGDTAEPHGFLSGGCIEADICRHAHDALADGQPRRLVYGQGGPPDIRLVCGGRIDVLLEPIPPGDPAVADLLALAEARCEAVWLSDGARRLCRPADALLQEDDAFASGLQTPLLEAMTDPSLGGAVLDLGAAIALRRPPRRRLVVVGHDPTALAIANLGLQSEFETWLLRPKGPAEPPPLPGLIYDRRPAAEALAAIGLDRWTYVAVATHDLEADEAALIAALASPAAYVGVLGARARLPERLSRLRARGVSDAQLRRLHAPIGLDLGGKAPFEVAVAVLAEVIAQACALRPAAWLRLDRDAAEAAA
jgi:xanthine dehydrogenase accessory factor